MSLDEQATDLKQYGLDPARIEVTFRFAAKDQKLLIGQKTPTGGDLYAKVPDKPRVFLVAAHLESTFNKSPFDLRDKTALKSIARSPTALESESAERTVEGGQAGSRLAALVTGGRARGLRRRRGILGRDHHADEGDHGGGAQGAEGIRLRQAGGGGPHEAGWSQAGTDHRQPAGRRSRLCEGSVAAVVFTVDRRSSTS